MNIKADIDGWIYNKVDAERTFLKEVNTSQPDDWAKCTQTEREQWEEEHKPQRPLPEE